MADAAVDSMKQQMLELCRTDTLSRVREQHDRDITVLKEQHNAALLALQQNLDSASRALSEQVCSFIKLDIHLPQSDVIYGIRDLFIVVFLMPSD